MNETRAIKLLLAYDGTRYAGWQRQKDLPTIQGVLEEKLAVMTGRPVVLHGAGRTDAGVHALGMVANFATPAVIPCSGFLKGLNSMLPADIRVLAAEETEQEFHARYSATGKCYFYNLTVGRVMMPAERFYSILIHPAPDWEKVRACLRMLVGRHDFSSFEATGSRDPDNENGLGAVREIHAAEVCPDGRQPEKFRIVISGNGFLRHMVRNIVGTVVEVGQGKRTEEDFRVLLKSRNRAAAGPTMPARGLFLKEVYYPARRNEAEE
jgi:tRNA pseudouridine38-40 synthase